MITMVEALQRCARQFRFYESEHTAKAERGFNDLGHFDPGEAGKAMRHEAAAASRKKAEVNRELAELCEEVVDAAPYQRRVHMWMMQCFGPAIAQDQVERGDRLLEEVFELLQSKGYDFSRIAQVRDYVAARPAGDPDKEMGDVAVCLFAAANAYDLVVGAAAERELDRIMQPEVMEKIRAKQAAKPSMSPLPQ